MGLDIKDGDRILADVKSMRKDVKSKQFDTEQLKIKYSFLYDNVLHLFDMVIADKIDYLPMVVVLCKKLKNIKNEDDFKTQTISVRKNLYNHYVPKFDNPELEDLGDEHFSRFQ